jgi:hypothetical protein
MANWKGSERKRLCPNRASTDCYHVVTITSGTRGQAVTLGNRHWYCKRLLRDLKEFHVCGQQRRVAPEDRRHSRRTRALCIRYVASLPELCSDVGRSNRTVPTARPGIPTRCLRDRWVTAEPAELKSSLLYAHCDCTRYPTRILNQSSNDIHNFVHRVILRSAAILLLIFI